MAEWCIPFWVTLILTLTSSSFLGFLCLVYTEILHAGREAIDMKHIKRD